MAKLFLGFGKKLFGFRAKELGEEGHELRSCPQKTALDVLRHCL